MLPRFARAARRVEVLFGAGLDERLVADGAARVDAAAADAVQSDEYSAWPGVCWVGAGTIQSPVMDVKSFPPSSSDP